MNPARRALPSRLPALLVAWFAALSLAGAARAQSYDPPANYYATATGTGATLKSQLHNIIDNHTVISYDAARSVLQVTDEDPADPDRMILVYDRLSVDVSAINPNGSIPGWDSAKTWNREHTWPESRLGDGGRAVSDLFNLRPSTTSVNGDRGNLNFGGAFGQPFGEVFDKGSTKWYPGDADAGMIARQEFYMAVRYDGSDSGTSNIELAAGNPTASGLLGDLDRMIEWHYAAPPDQFERRRNQTIYDQFQHNRNPFTDRPEFAWSVFVNQTNDSSLALQGAASNGDGATSLDVDLGRVLVGAPVPAAQNVTLSKNGLNGTYYQVTTSGAATSSVADRYNAFRTGTTGTKNISVCLAASTAAAGLKTGAVTIDNLDVTTGGGAGRGANDGNDVVNVSLSVLNHANPSFARAGDVNSLVYDFGSIHFGAPPATFSFGIFNLGADPDFTAALELDAIAASGAFEAFDLNLAPFTGGSALSPSTSRQFNATLHTSALGAFSATYNLAFSDEDLPGATALGTMTLTLTGTVEPPAFNNSDFDGDGVVDGADFLAWQRGFGDASSEPFDGDANGDLLVDATDLLIWGSQFGTARAAESAAIPEPAGLTLAVFFTVLVVVVRRHESWPIATSFTGVQRGDRDDRRVQLTSCCAKKPDLRLQPR